MEPIFAQIRDLRKKISGLILSVSVLVGKGSNEIDLAYNEVRLGFSWLGDILKVLNAPNPYPESRNAGSKKIEKIVDFAEKASVALKGGITTVNLKALRAGFASLFIEFNSLKDMLPGNKAYQNSLQEAWVHFRNADMWLGWELGNIKKKEGKDKTQAKTQAKIDKLKELNRRDLVAEAKKIGVGDEFLNEKMDVILQESIKIIQNK
jgi:hypothetical protein